MNGLNLKIIAEKINDSVPSTRQFFEDNDIEAILQLAVTQAEEGAAFIDVNVGSRTPEFMADLVTRIQDRVSVPLCIDSPSLDIQKAGIGAYDPAKANGEKPLVNSVSELRMELLELNQIQPVRYILMCTERSVDGNREANTTAEEIVATAQRLVASVKEMDPSITNDDLFLDPGMSPIGADTEGIVKASISAIEILGGLDELQGIHMSVGLSNFTVQLPSRTAAGELVKTPLECAFLTLTNANGLDHVIGSTKKKYRLLEDDHAALQTVKDVIALDGFDCLMRVQEFYS